MAIDSSEISAGHDEQPDIAPTSASSAIDLRDLSAVHEERMRLVNAAVAAINKWAGNKDEAIFAACLANDAPDVLSLIHDGVDVNIQSSEDGSTLLLISCICQNPSMAGLLLGCGASPIIQDKDGNSPLLTVCLNGNHDIYKLLMHNTHTSPAEMLNCYDADRKSPLLVAAQHGHLTIVTDILQRTLVHLNEVDNFGNSPLIAAVIGSHEEVVIKLLSIPGINVLQENDHGDSALLLATLRGNVALARALLYAGANKRCSNIDGITPIEVSLWNNDEVLFTLLMEDDGYATVIQSAWRMYKIRLLHGGKVDKQIAHARQSKWALEHYNAIVKIQTRIRMFNAKNLRQRYVLEAISDRVKVYAIMKIASVLLTRFRIFLHKFRERKAQSANNIKRSPVKAAPEDAAFVKVQTTRKRDETLSTPYMAENAPLITKLNQNGQKDSSILTPRAQKFAKVFTVSAALAFSNNRKEDLPEDFGTQGRLRPISDANMTLSAMINKGLPWEEISKKVASCPEEVAHLASSGEYPLQLALRLKASSSVVLGLLRTYPSAASAKNHMGNTSLHLFLSNIAEFDKKLTIFNALLSATEKSVSESNKDGEMPLHIAARYSDITCEDSDITNVAEHVIRALIDIHPQALQKSNFNGNLPLHICLQKNVSLNVFMLIFNEYPDAIHHISSDGRHPLRIALQNSCSLDVVRKVIELTGDNVSGAEGSGSALHIALKYKAAEEVLLDIIERNTETLKKVDNQGCLPLHLALKLVDTNPSITLKVIKSLLDHYDSAGGVPFRGLYPLQFALDRNMGVEIISALSACYPYHDELKTRATDAIMKASKSAIAPRSSEYVSISIDQLAASLPVSKVVISSQEERQARAALQTAQREERMLKIAQERAERQKEADQRRVKAKEEIAARLDEARNQRQEAMEIMQRKHVETEAKRLAYLKSLEAMQSSAVSAEVALQSENAINESMSKVSRWRKAVTASLEESKTDMVWRDSNQDTPQLNAESARPDAITSLQMWRKADKLIALTPSKSKRDESFTTPRNSSMELSPATVSRALSSILKGSDTDEE